MALRIRLVSPIGRTTMSNEACRREYFEELCALAASGEISETEFAELQDHMRSCDHCRAALADFVDFLHNKLPLADPEVIAPSKLSGYFSKDSSYRERFLARARKQGLAFGSSAFSAK